MAHPAPFYPRRYYPYIRVDLEVVKAIYEILKSQFQVILTAVEGQKRIYQYLLIVLSFASVLIGHFLRIYVDNKALGEAHNIQFCNSIITPIILCLIFWAVTSILAVFGIIRGKFWAVGYKNKDSIEKDFRNELGNPLKWYKDTIMMYQDIIELDTSFLLSNRRWLHLTVYFLIATLGLFAFTYAWLLYI